MTVRTVMRLAVVSAAPAMGLFLASPAFAADRDAGEMPGKGLSALDTFLLFGVVPVGAFLLIALLVVAPSIAREPRYRLDRGWQGEPQIFGAPPRAELPSGTTLTAGSQIQAPPAEGVAEGAEARPEGGGASARW